MRSCMSLLNMENPLIKAFFHYLILKTSEYSLVKDKVLNVHNAHY